MRGCDLDSSNALALAELLARVPKLHTLAADGWWGLLFRGLGTRLLANVLQSALFAVVWKYIEGVLNGS